MTGALEAVVWCPSCGVDKYEVLRVPTENEAVFLHVTNPENRGEKTCECGANLERKP